MAIVLTFSCSALADTSDAPVSQLKHHTAQATTQAKTKRKPAAKAEAAKCCKETRQKDDECTWRIVDKTGQPCNFVCEDETKCADPIPFQASEASESED